MFLHQQRHCQLEHMGDGARKANDTLLTLKREAVQEIRLSFA